MKHFMITGTAMVLLAGCAQMTKTANQVNDSTRAAVYKTAGRIQDLTRYEPEVATRQAPQTAFCYSADSDIICYDSPKPYLSNKLLGFQGYTAPAVPATVARAPDNASVSYVPTELPRSKAVVVSEQDANAPQTLMPRY